MSILFWTFSNKQLYPPGFDKSNSQWTQTFWQLSWLYDFAINTSAIFFVYEKLNIPELYSGPSWTFEIELFSKIVNGKEPLNIFKKSSFLDFWLGSEYVSTPPFPGKSNVLLGKDVSWGKIGRIKEWVFSNVWWNVVEQTIAFTPKNSVHLISLISVIKKIKWL